MLKTLMIKSTLIVFACCVSFAAHARADTPKQVSVPAGELVSALESLAKQAAVDLVYQPEQLKACRTSGVKGTYTPEAAIRILLKGTPLELHMDPSGAMVITPPRTLSDNSPSPGDGRGGQGGEDSSKTRDRLRLAQTDDSASPQPSTVEKDKSSNSQESSKKTIPLEEIVVTGSRIPRSAKDGAQDVKIYSREQIGRSGQTNISDFLNTLPEVSVSINENGFQTQSGATTVQLHGLPVGTTLVLLNGRRVETSGEQAFGNFFDLNNIPLSAVDRIEIVSEGSSAIYGSDAIAGVVNIVLRKAYDGLEADVRYGRASGIDETDASLAWGEQWSRGAFSVIGTYQTRSELTGFERSITSNGDHRAFGGIDGRVNYCNPGNVFSTDGSNLPGVGAPYAAVPANFTGTPTREEFAATAGTLNACSTLGYSSLIPPIQREGVLVQGYYKLTSWMEVFTELMYSHAQSTSYFVPPLLYGQPGFQSFTVSASNPYNPFGEVVGVADLLTALGRGYSSLDTEFFRPVVGIRGRFADTWEWELSGTSSQDSSTLSGPSTNNNAVQNALDSTDPTTALNPFVAGAQGSPQLLQSFLSGTLTKFTGKSWIADGFVRGAPIKLPSGPLEVVLGAQYERNSLYSDAVNDGFHPPNTQTTNQRVSYSVFGEARVPILANHSNSEAGDILAATLAGRYDHYDDFGGRSTPQFGVEWRPFETLLLRSTYGKAFKAPSLHSLYFPQTILQGVTVVDPLRGGQVEAVESVGGGNPNLRAETGQSRTFGFVYTSKAIPSLRLSITNWKIDESNSIQSINRQTIVNNESIFPGDVIRAPACLGGPPCPITQVYATYLNYGDINIEGFDYQVSYSYLTKLGQLSPSLSATQTYRYSAALVPGSPPTDRTSKANNDGNFASRWKGTAALGWKLGPYEASVDTRYVGHYQDYDSTNMIGNFWITDASVRYAIGQSFAPDNLWLKGAYVVVGGVNLFNRLPQYSNYQFGFVGYDPAEADIRGRFLYAQISVKR